MPLPHPAARAHCALALLIIVLYVGVAFRVGAVFPFFDFPMYSEHTNSASRLVVRDEAGSVAEVPDYEGWMCPGLAAAARAQPPLCASPTGSNWTQDELDGAGAVVGYLERHAAEESTGPMVQIVQRVYRFEDPWGQPAVSDCVVMACRATRRGDHGH